MNDKSSINGVRLIHLIIKIAGVVSQGQDEFASGESLTDNRLSWALLNDKANTKNITSCLSMSYPRCSLIG